MCVFIVRMRYKFSEHEAWWVYIDRICSIRRKCHKMARRCIKTNGICVIGCHIAYITYRFLFLVPSCLKPRAPCKLRNIRMSCSRILEPCKQSHIPLRSRNLHCALSTHGVDSSGGVTSLPTLRLLSPVPVSFTILTGSHIHSTSIYNTPIRRLKNREIFYKTHHAVV
jgi:hypothetical protein